MKLFFCTLFICFTVYAANPYELYIDAEDLYRQGKLFESVEVLDNALQYEPKFLKAIYLKAKIFEELNEYKKALECYKTINEIEKEISDRQKNLDEIDAKISSSGKIKEYNEKVEAAEEIYRQGNNLASEGKFREAFVSFKKCIELNPDSSIYYKATAAAAADCSDFDDAIKYYLRAIELVSDDFDVYFALARIYKAADRMQEYENILRHALSIATSAEISDDNAEAISQMKDMLSRIRPVKKTSEDRVYVIKRIGKNLYLNRGLNNGIPYTASFSRKFTVFRNASVIRDIETSQALLEQQEISGTIVISSVEEQTCKAIILKEQGKGVRIGDFINLSEQPQKAEEEE